MPSEPVNRYVVFARDDGICHLCLRPVDPEGWHLDHIIPISRGGANRYDNVAVSHPFCNLSKHDKVLI